ncbi:MAG TPA: uroporphyrinogen-III C-methyltransferase [Burkholderiales bacterium]|nr:uroporphyrinogen-III C-methyltransferase [Burkholderiales bacterium]
MSENNTTELKNEQPAMVKTVNKPRMSKVPVLLAILSLSCTGYLAYQSFLGINGFIAQSKLNSQQSQKIAALSTDNLRLTQQIKQLTQEQTALKEQVDKTNKTVNNGNMVLYQLNSLISGANQSLLLYHDYASAIKQLNYAKQILTSVSDPLLLQLKINLTIDLDNLQAKNNFDATMLATQLDELYQNIAQLNITTPVALQNQQDNLPTSAWQRFVMNVKQSIFGLVKVVKANSDSAEILVPENELVVRQHLQLDILSARQALLNQNAALWQSSLNDAYNLTQRFFSNDLTRQKELLLIQQLREISLGVNQPTLDLTMQALIKAQQLSDGNK